MSLQGKGRTCYKNMKTKPICNRFCLWDIHILHRKHSRDPGHVVSVAMWIYDLNITG